MSLDVSRDSSAHLARGGVVLGTAMVVFVAYALPFIGLLASLGLPFLTHTFRRHLWPDASTTRSMVWSLVAWVGVWLPGLLGVFTPVFAGSEGDGGMEVSTVWLVIPLCAPDSLDDVLLPALAAAVTCLVGLLGAVATRRGWLWVTAAWLAPWVHHLVFSRTPHEFFC